MRLRVLATMVMAVPIMAMPTNAVAEGLAPECQGKPATIVVPNDGGVTDGTEGDDVIVASGLVEIRAAGGDDTICLTGHMPITALDRDYSEVDGGPGLDSLQVRASDKRDVLAVWDVDALDIRMGAGFDELHLSGAFGAGAVDGGAGGGYLIASAVGSVEVDLVRQFVSFDGGDGVYDVRRFDDVYGGASRVRLVGDADGNVLRSSGCQVTLSGGRGADALLANAYRSRDCSVRRFRLSGLKGDDRLEGTTTKDVLIGGPGRDRAIGHGGVDRCVAEQEATCER
jgi:Ca2+-binding RTX toxin-like protein